ncbi:hypothetical protein NP493_428g02018 [Ridgeia piscesae]|uniref:Uncharacterized protein n=1 Tax=Ridgeia piscesae TaxID=27915 RepID=A0AAD9L0G6_RIDPI|nr:hypothetical protein NP493_428g02018 [Ridgeia piscesae]
MASCVLHLLSFVYVVIMTHAQSTRSEYPGCVCTVNVPPSDCGQRSRPSVDVQLLKSSVIALQEQVVTLASDNRKLADDVGDLRRELSKSNTGTINQASSTGGAVYIRWGRKTCPGNGTDLLYWGVAAGSHYTHSGGGSNYLCLPRNPEWGKTTAGFQYGESLYGAEYETSSTNDPFPKVNGRSLVQNNVPCAL